VAATTTATSPTGAAGQVGQRMPAVEVLVLAEVLHDTVDRPGLDLATRIGCRGGAPTSTAC
jgi:hypothetical protein